MTSLQIHSLTLTQQQNTHTGWQASEDRRTQMTAGPPLTLTRLNTQNPYNQSLMVSKEQSQNRKRTVARLKREK